MFDTLFIMPIPFWAVIGLLVAGGIRSLRHLKDGSGLPVLAALGTTAAWYLGDVFYNDYANNHARLFDPNTLEGAWWQVAWFLLVFLVATPIVHRTINARQIHRGSGIMQLFKHGVGQPTLQQQLKYLFWGCVGVWSGLFLIAVMILKSQIVYYLFPFLGYKAMPWSHGQIGVGIDALSIVAMYLQLLSASLFGVVAALTTDRRIRHLAFLFCVLSWPSFIFDRTRNTMLAMTVPAVLCWVFLRLRGGVIKKGVVLLVCFLAVNTWMKFVIANRSHTTITAAFKEKGLSGHSGAHNEGLNMFEELCWISTLIDRGTYKVTWGGRYFAELVNPIPRGLWRSKPLIGLDYAIARGSQVRANGAVDTTIATGFIGQGVVNFDRFLGPAAAALLLSLWVAWLAKLDLNIQALGRLPLYSLGLILTFNLGRDITLITLYPFVFGMGTIWLVERWFPRLNYERKPARHQVRTARMGAERASGAGSLSSNTRSGTKRLLSLLPNSSSIPQAPRGMPRQP